MSQLARRYPRSLAFVLVSAVALAGTTGCDKVKEKLAEKVAEKALSTGGAEVDLGSSSGTVTVKDAKGGGAIQVGEGAKLPDGWPSNVPVYPGAKLVAAMSAPKGKTITLTSKDSAEKVIAFYKGKLPGKVLSQIDMGQMKILGMEDGSTKLTVSAQSSSDPDGETSVTVSLATP